MYKFISRQHWLFKTTKKVDTFLTPPTANLVHTNFTDNIYKKFNNCQLLNRFLCTMATGNSEVPRHTNRLIEEKSPYLLQHAHNPVDWYPWCEEAIQRARRENKLIFLSVGYSTCHWCHVMEHESFENESVANLMNDNFINIKVDREERPDIDKIYMQFVLMINGGGGWPMSVWLTPDLAPISAGTYFPPQDRWGMPSFTTVLRAIAHKWANNHDELQSTGLQVIEALKKSLSEKSPSEMMAESGRAEVQMLQALNIYKRRFDKVFGGFGSQPKFPEVSRLNFLFHAFITTRDNNILEIVLQTLEHIGCGGIHDHVFGGFSRYSVDRYWHVPHFEKMLYDQGQLMSAFAIAYKLTNEPKFLTYADGIYRYITRDLQHPGGGFFAGEDADSLPHAKAEAKIEGAFYAWEAKEILQVITDNIDKYASGLDAAQIYEIYADYYDVRKDGNVEEKSDPHGHLTGKNILIVRTSAEQIINKFNVTATDLDAILEITNNLLDNVRNQRPRPHLDTKIICSWNGLVLSGLSKLADCGGEKRNSYITAGQKLISFIRENLFDEQKQILLRTCYGKDDDRVSSGAQIDGFLDDYAFLIRGLLDFYKTSLDENVLRWAKDLQDLQDKWFWDDQNGAYYFSKADSANVIVRIKDDHDGAEPCGNSMSATNLILLSNYFNDENYAQRVKKLLDYFADADAFGYTLPEMMSAILLMENGIDLVAVVGPIGEQNTQQFIEIIQKFYIPGIIVLRVDPQQPALAQSIYNQRMQEKFKMIDGKTTVYICHDKVCRLPVTDPTKLEQNLRELFFKN